MGSEMCIRDSHCTNGNGAHIIAHASLADVPVSNLKDLDLKQGDTITNAVNICMMYNIFGVTFFA